MSVNVLPATDTIDAATLEQLRRQDSRTRILDVREGFEFETAHIPGSYNVPLDTLAEHSQDLADLEHPIVLVCQSGGRATQAHGTLTSAGKDTLHILEGGMNGWIGASGEVTRGENQRWAMDRQIRLMAGTVALASVLASTVIPKAKWIAAGIGAGLTYVSVTDNCPITPMVAMLPYNRTDRCDIAGVLAELNSDAA
jgi:rhodanese-related sulfurtransferase